MNDKRKSRFHDFLRLSDGEVLLASLISCADLQAQVLGHLIALARVLQQLPGKEGGAVAFPLIQKYDLKKS